MLPTSGSTAPLSGAPYLPDYRARAKALPDVEPTVEQWHNISSRSSMHPGRGSRKLNAEMWLFAEITGRPLEHSGGWQRRQRAATDKQNDAGRTQLWKDYVRFYRRELTHLRAALTEHAANLAHEVDGVRGLDVPGLRLLRGLAAADFE